MSHAAVTPEWHEECGVFGIWAPGQPVASQSYLGLFALQHRGQESAGMIVTDGMHVDVEKGMGLVTSVFKKRMPSLCGHSAIGHVRYSTMGASFHANIQPIFAFSSDGLVSLAHNGSLTNAKKVRDSLEKDGCIFQTTSDSESILNLIVRSKAQSMEEKVLQSVGQIEGAYSLVIMTGDKLFGVRDPNGFHPLCLGELPGGGYVLASESCALDAVEAAFVRDILPGEMVVIDQNGIKSHRISEGATPRCCIFEYIYFARPDSTIDGLNVWQARFRMGEQLAKEYTAEADVVVPVPDTGIAAAIGFSAFSGIPYREGLIKNRYIGRTFILPDQSSRSAGVKMKLSPVKANLEGKRVILIDDSIVRGTTSARLISLLREAGAKEVHMCVSSPPITYPCYYGIDTSIREELIAAVHSTEEIRRYIGADSLYYISQKGLLDSVNDPCDDRMCTACFDGRYPTNVEECLSPGHKSALG